MDTYGTTVTGGTDRSCGGASCLDGGWQLIVLIGLLALAIAYASYAPARFDGESFEMANGAWLQQPVQAISV